MLDFFWSLLFFVIALGLLVAVHEWGHFWVARRCGVYVERFSVGFGKALWKRKDAQGTEYVIAAIPLGGYVKMLDERADDVPEDKLHLAFNRQSVGKRIAIIAAGPITNFIFAIFALMLMYLVGVQAAKPMVGEVLPDSIAASAGVEPGMEIVAIDGVTTEDWKAVNLQLIGHIGESHIAMTVKPSNSNISRRLELNTELWQFDPDKDSALRSLGFQAFRPQATTTLAYIAEDSAAERAGLLAGDKILHLDGTVMGNWEQIVGYIEARPSEVVKVAVEREGQLVTLTATTGEREVEGQTRGFLGVVPRAEEWPQGSIVTHQYGILDAILKGAEDTWRLTTLSFAMIGKLLTGDVSVDNLSGPISIAQGAGASASYGLVYFLSFLALISVNLGVINLLPLPVLDGGHLLYYFIEFLSGRPVPESIQNIGFRIGGALLMLLMAIAIVNDIGRL